MTLLHGIIVVGVGYFFLTNKDRTIEFIEDCLGMSVDYTARKWPDLSKRVLAKSSKTVQDLYERAKKKRGDVA